MPNGAIDFSMIADRSDRSTDKLFRFLPDMFIIQVLRNRAVGLAETNQDLFRMAIVEIGKRLRISTVLNFCFLQVHELLS